MNSINSLKANNKMLTENREIANAFNGHFVSVGPELAQKIESKAGDDPIKHIPQNIQSRFSFKEITLDRVLFSLKQLKSGKASGPDKIPTTLVKDASEQIALPLAMIFNASLENGIFPQLWKLARVAPIYKSGARDDGNNYRPISVLGIFSRIFEKITHDQLFEYLDVNNTLTKNRYAFRKFHSTITSMISSTDYWLQNVDNRNINMTLFLDLKKAFDTVNHQILIEKLFAYGVKGTEIEWFKSYLSDRQQF